MIKRHVAIRPCLNNIAHNSKEADQLPADPVLSVLHLTFHSGVDVSEPSQLVSVLWQKSLTFVSTIPGFQRLYWAPVDPGWANQEIIALIQWDSGRGWRLFQSSLGFSMILGYIESISNRCVQLALPANLSSLDSVLELVSFRFSTILSTDQVDQPGFKSKWSKIFAPYLSNATAESELIYCCGEWLEADKASEDRFFVSLLFWKPDLQAGNQRQLQGVNNHNLEDQIADLVKDTTEVVSCYTRQLHQVSRKTYMQQISSPLPVSIQSGMNHPVFQTPVWPEYSLNDATFSRGCDQLHLDSMRQARETPPQRIAGGPAGIWYPMGIISQHNLPMTLGYSFDPDMDWISFRARAENPRVTHLFEDLRRKLWGMGDCPRLFWGKESEEEGNCDKIALFIGTYDFASILSQDVLDSNTAVLEGLEYSQHQKPEIRAQLQQYIQQFSDGCGDAIQDLSYRGFRGLRPFSVCPDMDITVFDVSENERDRRSFEYAFSNYWETTRQEQFPGSVYSPWSALIPAAQGWLTEYLPSSDQSRQTRTVQFISVFTCKRRAREEWYSDFAQRAQTQYDLLGHIVDWLRTLSKRITTQHLVMGKEDPWMTADKLEKERRTRSTTPPSIFDIPWAKQSKK